MSAGDLFLFGIAACAVGMLEMVAKEAQMPLQWTDVTVEASLDMTAPPVRPDVTVFHSLRVEFKLTGVNESQGQQLVEIYKQR